MNPSNFFGRQQGAFQAPGNTNRSSGMFQTFGQQGTSSGAQNVGFAQTASFGQPSAFSQPSVFGQSSVQTVFGQSPAFGQTPAFGQSGGLAQGSGQSSTFSTVAQTPAFGQQTAMGQSTPGFGAPPSYAQSTGQSPSLAFGQTPAFGQTSAFGQASGFAQQTSGFGLSSNMSQSSGSTSASGAGQPMNFGQSSFGQQSAFSLPTATSSTSGGSQSVVQSGGFGTSDFSFKPSNEAVFKPIFSASPEPINPQPTTVSEPFGSVKPAVSSMDSSGPESSGFPLLTGVKPGTLGFSFSQPGAAPSIAVPSASLPQKETLTSSSNLQFTFSQPANPSSSSTTTVSLPTAVPSSPSSFSFSAKVLQPQAESKMSLFGGAGFGQVSAFGVPKVKPEATAITEERGGDDESTGEVAFGSLGKGTKRKEEPVESTSAQGKSAQVEDARRGADAPRHPSKRPLLKSRGPAGGLFRSAMSGLLKSAVNPVKKEPKKEEERPPDWGQVDRPDPPAPTTHMPVTPPRAQAPTRDVLEKAEEMGLFEAPEPEPVTQTPARRSRRGESTESLGGMYPTDATVIQCKEVPANLNKKGIIEKHFGRFGKVRKVLCRPDKNLAIVHFQDHASAAKAKKRGKSLDKNEILIFWQRKKQSPGEKGERLPEGKELVSEATDPRSGGFQSSPLRKPLPRSPAVSSTIALSKGSPVKKSSTVKALQFDTEPQHDSSSEGQSSERPVSGLPSSLLHLIGQVAETAEEKYRLLEQRDKILRQGRPKRTDLDLSKVFVGTCPDMCPEKERYMRETRNQLSSFELISETEGVDHYAAIKEYSRSSADQEEPLPHELRPLCVLSMTMDYLVTQIMDQVALDNYRDWYDFVWNRTRGIRKDIIQQHLCDPVTVSLIEKCTRFHIHCAHHLCQEQMMTFDAKINNENMTKCLQSLKEMYQDLATREVYSPHEAELRQYSVLLKLNDGDILREVQQFREEVRNSPEVKFAVQAFAALNSNNFVRFFKLVNAASYLASCILHRYFNQVRREALKALNVAYTVGSQRSTIFPIEDVVRMLMFRTVAEASGFVQQYGLNISDGMVELSRTAYQEPDLSLPQRRSVFIEGKRTVLIGQVVNGGPLPNPPQHTPFCSFDSYNKYRAEGPSLEPPSAVVKAGPMGGAALPQRQELKPLMDVEPQPKHKLLPGPGALADTPLDLDEPVKPTDAEEPGEIAPPAPAPTQPADPPLLFQPIVQPQPVRPPSPPPKPEPVYLDEDIMVEVESVVEEVLVAEVSEVASTGGNYVSTALSVSDDQLEAIVSEVMDEMLRDMSTAEINTEKERIAEEKRKMEEARRKQEHEAFLAQFSTDLCSEISAEVLTECIQETAASEIQRALAEKAACVARSSEDVCNSLVEETLDIEIGQLAQDILDVELQRIHKFLKRWRDVVAVRRQLKRQMRGFPAAPCCVDPRFKLKALAPSAPSSPSLDCLARGLVNLGNAGNMAVSCTRLLKMRQEAIHQMRVHFFYRQLLSEWVWTPLDLPTLVTESIPNPPDRIFWKAALLLPSDHESATSISSRILTDWLEAKFGGGEKAEESEREPDGRLQTLSISNGLRDLGHKTHKVHVCVKVTRGPLSEEGQSQLEEQKELLGTNALLMLLPPMPSTGHGCLGQEEDVPLLSALLQLRQVQQASSWHAALPLAVVVPGQPEGTASDQKLEEDLMLKTLVEDGLISEYVFIHIPETTNDIQGTEQVNQAVKWLAAHSPPSSLLSSQTLVHFVEAGLCREFSARLYHDKQDRAGAGLPCQDPAPITQLYNSVLGFLAGLVSSERFSSLSWPPSEFSLPETRDLLPHLDWNSPSHLAWLKRAILSLQLPEWDLPPVTAAWPRLCASIFQYASQIPTSRHSQPLLMSRLENLLGRVRTRCPLGESEDEDDEKAGPSFNQIPWDEIVALCIDHRLKDWQPPECPVAEDVVTEDGEILVYFHKDGLRDFQPPASWVEAVQRTHREKQQETEGSEASPRRNLTPALRLPKLRLFQSLALEEPPSVLDITHTPSPRELLPHRVLANIQQERAQSQRFEEQLQRWLEVEPLDSLSTPLFLPSSLLSLPQITAPTWRSPAAAASLIQEMETDGLVEKGDWVRGAPVSMAQRLKDLDRLILASKEEELACGLKLSRLLDIVED